MFTHFIFDGTDLATFWILSLSYSHPSASTLWRPFALNGDDAFSRSLQSLRNSLHLMEPESSLPCLRQQSLCLSWARLIQYTPTSTFLYSDRYFVRISQTPVRLTCPVNGIFFDLIIFTTAFIYFLIVYLSTHFVPNIPYSACLSLMS
jgi:hypothetical protein